MNGDGTPQTTWSGGVTLTEGPYAGWTTWSRGGDPYETLIGPFYFRWEDGGARCVFEPQAHHLNGGGAIHGGCMMSFADFSLFAIAHNVLAGGHAVTLTFNSEFVGAGAPGVLVESRGEVVRDTRSVVFVRGIMTQAERPLLSYSGTLKKIARRD
ncbi:MAG: PaaI family thioesterase [Alphaproteobacteria bacterium]|nr:PaaI family thioesterase [Alphaproteobacteria bacterium]